MRTQYLASAPGWEDYAAMAPMERRQQITRRKTTHRRCTARPDAPTPPPAIRRRLAIVLTLIALFMGGQNALSQDAEDPGTTSQQPRPSEPTGTANAGAAESPQSNDQQPGTDPSDNSEALDALPTAEGLQQRIDALEGLPNLTDAQKGTIRGLLSDALARLNQANKDREDRERFAAREVSLPDRVKTLAEQIDNLQRQRPTADADVQWYSGDQLKQELQDAEKALADARSLSQTADSDLLQSESDRSNIPSEIQRLRTEPENPADAASASDPPAMVTAKEIHRKVVLKTRQEHIETLQQRLEIAKAETEYLQQRAMHATALVQWEQSSLQFWSSQVSSARLMEVADYVTSFKQEIGIDDNKDPNAPLVIRKADLWKSYVRITSEINQRMAAENVAVDALKKQLEAKRKEIQDDVRSKGALPGAVALELLQIRDNLPSAGQLQRRVDAVDSRIDDLRRLRAEIDLQLNRSDRDTLVLDDLGARERSKLTRVQMEQHAQLLGEMRSDIEQSITANIQLKSVRDSHVVTAAALRELVQQHVLWIRNDVVFRGSQFQTAWLSIAWLFHPERLQRLMQRMGEATFRRLDLMIVWAIFGIGLLFAGKRLRQLVNDTGRQTKQWGQSSMRPTRLAILLTVLMTLPTVILPLAPGLALGALKEPSMHVDAVRQSLLLLACALAPLELLRQIMRPGGLAAKHFDYRESMMRPLRRSLRYFIDLGAPLLLLWGVVYHLEQSQVSSSLGRLLFAAGMLLVAFLIAGLLHPQRGLLAEHLRRFPDGWLDQTRLAWYPIMILAGPALAALSLFGYSYAAQQMVSQAYYSLWLLIGLIMAGGIMRRWVVLNHRRMLMAQLEEQRQEEEQRPEEQPVAEETTMISNQPLHEINAQTSRLVGAVLVVIGLVGFWLIWSPLLPATRMLSSVELYPIGDRKITLESLFYAVPVLVLSIIAFRNLPGLLESVLLDRLPLQKPARYAITTVSSYLIAMVGLIALASVMGLKWENIQWLVAALSVGLGFGLQEIFANLVCGMILLLEQPIRIGDVVTLGDTTGVVSRIRMRATTITNWDRQEFIIPNRDLITGQLINWTLTDSVNRIVIHIGIAYGSDTTRACALLREICESHPHVTKEPSPLITFEGFGDSTLNIVVRCFLENLDNRMGTTHDLHTTINERFEDEGIEIAFPQLDIHVRGQAPQLNAA
ncbi:MAG: mechanosensitive ion channel domain-containing protein [Planctomycetota bacterium]